MEISQSFTNGNSSSTNNPENELKIRKVDSSNLEENIEHQLTKEVLKDDDENSDDKIPDGGLQAWISIFAGLLLIIATWGANSATGVLLQFYLNNNAFPGASEYDYALITCIVVALAQILTPFALLFLPLIGFKKTLFFGCFLNFLGYLLASFSTKIWQLYLTQGVLVGVAFAFLFNPGTIIIPQWFLRKRALASGIVVGGAGLGGIIFSLSVNPIIEKTGNQRWALRYLAIATTVLSLIATILIKPRVYRKVPFSKTYIKQQFKILFDFSVLKEFSPSVIGMWFVFCFLAYSMELYTLSDYCTSVGLTAKQGSIITAIFNVGQTIGRPSLGYFADTFGRINFTIFLCLFNLITFFGYWLNATTYAQLIGYSFLSGTSMGVGSLMMQPLCADNVSTRSKFPAAYSLINFLVGCSSLVSEVIPLALRNQKMEKPYFNAQIYGGCCLVVAILIIFMFREWKIRKVLQEKSTDNNENDKLKYDKLLKNNLKNILIRMFYPLKV